MRPMYNSRDLTCKSPFGAVPSGETVRFSIHLAKVSMDRNPVLRIHKMDHWDSWTDIEMLYSGSDHISNTFSCEFTPERPELLAYYFELYVGGVKKQLRRSQDNTATYDDKGTLWQLTVYDGESHAPSVLRGGVFYQIFPDRFHNSGIMKENIPPDRILRPDWGALPYWQPDYTGEIRNNDYFGGDLQGIIDRIEYLESLGVKILYLNPIFEAHTNHRYDTADYMNVDPLLGTNDDFSRLCKIARKHGISVILDGVFNHTGSDSMYFNINKRYGSGGAFNDPESPYVNWYSFKRYPNEYESWWGFKTLPNVNESNPEYREFICGENGVIKHWLRLGASGFRLDVADELPDDFIDDINRCIKSYDPDCAMIGEVWEDASNKVSYGVRRRYLLGGQFDSIMNYPFMNAILSFIRNGTWKDFLDTVMQIIENYPRPVLNALMNMLSTHDTPRALTALAGPPFTGNTREWQEKHHYLRIEDYKLACSRYVLASIVQFGLPGIPCIYYGDEAGLSGYRDPFNRVCYPWRYQNAELINKISSLGALRNDHPFLSDAEFSIITVSATMLIFIRYTDEHSMLFAVNRSAKPERILFPDEFQNGGIVFTHGEYSGGMLGALSGIIIAAEKPRDFRGRNAAQHDR